MESLASIPKLNKAQFISSFINSQRANAKAYAEEGKAVAFSWASGDTTQPKASESTEAGQPGYRNFGFATPVIKPRGLKRGNDSPPKDENTKKSAKTGHINATGTKSRTVPTVTRTSEVKTKGRSRKKTNKESTGLKLPEIKEDRLEERRERKRAKREAVKSAASQSEDEGSKISTNKKKTKASGRTKRNKDIPPGLALMHGFSATNVGKGRLTMAPRIVGVFNKGKASAKVSVNTKASDGKNKSLTFLEAAFLDKSTNWSKRDDRGTSQVRSQPRPRRKTSSSCGPQKTSTDLDLDPDATEGMTLSNGNETEEETSTSNVETPKDETDRAKSPDPAGRLESEIWDIELEGAALPSAISHSRSDLIFDTRQSAWTKRVAALSGDPNPQSSPMKMSSGLDRPSSSIAPSQSASQYRAPQNPLLFTSSKYFQAPAETLLPTPQQVTTPISLPTPDGLPISASPRSISSLSKPLQAQITTTRSSEISVAQKSFHDISQLAPVPNYSHIDDQESDAVSCHDNVCANRRLERALTPYFTDVDYAYADASAPIREPYVGRESWERYSEMMEFSQTAECEPQSYDVYASGLASNQQMGFDDESDCYGSEDWAWQPTHFSAPLDGQMSEQAEDVEDETYLISDVMLHDGDFGSEYDIAEDGNGSMYALSTGPELLVGLPEEFHRGGMMYNSLAAAEADVVGALRGHWFPHRF